MQKREELIAQVKHEYARLAAEASQRQATQATDAPTPEAYYEKQLNRALSQIEGGAFDACSTGMEIVAALEGQSR